ncbi:MAG TPA: universal stress protein [Polaromonas sp.]|uniref:universal stress protein n=1 Tax=Polaromonas sp. UBA4122 TaxID=1947074 RepID=UPI000EE84EF4|nr:universal stress protein [Polaromonas sp. UBA4122]HAL40132.1 universal stress protein [Polaromonas sp.]
MFTHLLLPTDGSQASEAAIQKSIQFAKEAHAKVTGVHVIPEFHVLTYKTAMLEDTREQFAKDCKAHAAQFLAVIEKAAKEAGVACETAYVISDYPYEAIVKMAEDKGCDLITMASHGRKGVKGFLLGSETQKVLVHSKKPVLVFH